MQEKLNAAGLLVLDWGIGGLPLFQKIRAALPDASLVYLSDSGNTPYGKQTFRQLENRLAEIAAFARGRGIPAAAVACNAMSSVLNAPRTSLGGVEVYSLIHAFLACLAKNAGTEKKRAGVIGGKRTIESGIYQKAFTEAGRDVSACSAQELSALIEAGDFAGIPAVLEKAFAALGDIDELVLACTHYPAAAPLIRETRPALCLVDPGEALYAECIKRLAEKQPAESGGVRLYTTGNPGLAAASARKAFGFEDLRFEKIPLSLDA